LEDQEVMDKLLSKFPAARQDRPRFISPDAGGYDIPEVTSQEVSWAITSTKRGLATGPTLLSVDLLKIGLRVAESEHLPLKEGLARLFTSVLRGTADQFLRDCVTEGFLYPVGKKVRPIVVDDAMTKLTSKILAKRLVPDLPEHLTRYQKCFSRSGTETVHLNAFNKFNTFAEGDPKKRQIIATLDFANGYGSLHRDAIFQAVRTHLPQALPYVQWAYGGTVELHTRNGEVCVKMERGVKQGDPMAPIIFALVLHEAIADIVTDMEEFRGVSVWAFLDDLIIVGEPGPVRETITLLEQSAKLLESGLSFAPDKSRSYWPSFRDTEEAIAYIHTDEIYNIARFFRNWGTAHNVLGASKGMILLGIPMGSTQYLISIMEKMVEDHQRKLDLLTSIPHSSIALVLLRQCLGVKSINHVLKVIPPQGTIENLCRPIDAQVRQFLAKLLPSMKDPMTDAQFDLASLPLRLGGLGLTRAEWIAEPAFLGCMTSVSSEEVTLPSCFSPIITYAENNLLDKLRKYEVEIKEQRPLSQKTWTNAVHNAEFNRLMACRHFTDSDKFRIMSQTAAGASIWLGSPFFRSSEAGPAISQEYAEFLIVSMLCGTFLTRDTTCPLQLTSHTRDRNICGDHLDRKLAHTSTCKTRNTTRHDNLVDAFQMMLQDNDIRSKTETRVMDDTAEGPARCLRPGDVDFRIMDGKKNERFLVDFAVVAEVPLEGGVIRWSGKSADAHRKTKVKEKEKSEKYKNSIMKTNATFTPLVCSTTGGWGQESCELFTKIARYNSERNYTSQAYELGVIRRTLTTQVLLEVAENISVTLETLSSQ
jgi:hypothetical protein